MYALFIAWLCESTGCDVFIADYRLAPEFPFPAGLLDAVSVAEALHDGGVDPSSLIVAGDSGGGGLLTSLFQDARAHHLPRPAGALLFSPEVDLVLDEPSVRENWWLDILPRQIPVRPYLGDVDPHNKFVSAIYADLHGFPPTLVAFGDQEVFRDAIRRFVDELRRDGVTTVSLEEPDMFHMYMMLMPWAAASQRLYTEVGRFVEACLEGRADELVPAESSGATPP
jgi:acetyl esterase/lipase